MGDVSVARRDLARAQLHYGEALAMRRVIAQAHPDDEQAERDVANALYRMALWLPNGPVAWAEVVAALEALERRGRLRPADLAVLQEARAQAARQGAR
jgi:hypothetical protein